jgi:putative spermidine/putrescine transport system ATP-binding protein
VSRSEVELLNITKRFGRVTAVDQLDLIVGRAEFLAILGPSGCGKTTTLRMIAGLVEPDAGKVIIRGRDVTEEPPHRRGLGMVFQDYALFPHMSVFDNVAFGLRMRRVAESEIARRVQQVLKLVRLPDVGERLPKQLSGGQQQRVALARALAIEPAVLLLDEPLSNLDLKLRNELRVELKEIQRQVEITTIFVTHDQGEALSLSDRVAIMRDGILEQIGAPLDLYERPQTRFVATFLGEANLFRGRVESGAGKVMRAEDGERIPLRDDAPESAGEVVVRPEKITLHTDPQLAPALEGRINAMTYTGPVIRYYVTLPAGRVVMVDVPQVGRMPVPEGTQVWLTWAPENSVVLVPEGPARGAETIAKEGQG